MKLIQHSSCFVFDENNYKNLYYAIIDDDGLYRTLFKTSVQELIKYGIKHTTLRLNEEYTVICEFESIDELEEFLV